MTLRRLFLPALMLGVSSVFAQSPYDDDIYYDASKDTKTKQENAAYKKAQAERKAREAEERRLAEQAVYQQLYQQYYGNYDPERGGQDYEAAGNQTLDNIGSDRDVDEYNRRGAYAKNSASDTTTVNSDDFAYTRRIERFHNGDIISDINDPELVDYYYSSQTQPEINVYYINDPWSNWGWPGWNNYYWGPYSYSPYLGWNNYWSWHYGWGPSWNWSWGWGPSWSWGYPGWGWGYPGYYPGWSGPAIGHINSRYTPNGRRPTGIRNGYTGLGSAHRGQLSGSHNNNSYGNNRYQLTPGQAGNYRPSQSNNYRPSQGNTYRPGQSGVTTRPNNSTYTPNTTSGNRNRSYNTNRNTSNYNSGSYNSGSTSRGGWGGGNSGGTSGGGSHRGGRR